MEELLVEAGKTRRSEKGSPGGMGDVISNEGINHLSPMTRVMERTPRDYCLCVLLAQQSAPKVKVGGGV